MSDETNWENEVDSVQRGGVTKRTKVRRNGDVSTPKASDDHEAEDEDRNDGSDGFGIPVQFKD